LLTYQSGIIYPIAWGVCEGANLISPDSEAVFYGVLDFLAKPIFGALLLWGHKGIDPARLGLAIKDYDGDAIVHEKRHPVCQSPWPAIERFTNIFLRRGPPLVPFPTWAVTTMPPLLSKHDMVSQDPPIRIVAHE
jgi:hypothetical protein